jgi:hypothetical protein
MFYDITLEIAEMKTKRKGADAISALHCNRDPPRLTPQELKTIFESDAAANIVQVAPQIV